MEVVSRLEYSRETYLKSGQLRCSARDEPYNLPAGTWLGTATPIRSAQPLVCLHMRVKQPAPALPRREPYSK